MSWPSALLTATANYIHTFTNLISIRKVLQRIIIMTLHKVTSMNNILATKLKPFFSKVLTSQENHENRL